MFFFSLSLSLFCGEPSQYPVVPTRYRNASIRKQVPTTLEKLDRPLFERFFAHLNDRTGNIKRANDGCIRVCRSDPRMGNNRIHEAYLRRIAYAFRLSRPSTDDRILLKHEIGRRLRETNAKPAPWRFVQPEAFSICAGQLYAVMLHCATNPLAPSKYD